MNISLFWSSNLRKDSETFNHWRHRRISLSTFHEATLLSHVKAGNTVRLYTYQNFGESVPIPPEISVEDGHQYYPCLLYTSPSPRDVEESRMPSSA